MQQAHQFQDGDLVSKDEFYEHVIRGLSKKNKTLHPKYFYDKKGSEYFDQICQLDEYYPYKTELALLPKVARSVAEILTEDYALIEFGAGSLLKVEPLLEHVRGIEQFIPIDISGEHLRDACSQLSARFPALHVHPVEGDFTQQVVVPCAEDLQRIGFFPGSTIGNFSPSEAQKFLQQARATLGPNSYLLIGVDTKKSPTCLHRAYNDAQGVTAAFNLNLLHRVNQHFDANIDVAKFEHYAFYNATKGCVEMHLVCLHSHEVVLDEVSINFTAGETIHTESSYKYTPQEFGTLAESSGWHVHSHWLADHNMFSVFLLQNAEACV